MKAKKPPGGGFSTNRLLESSGAAGVPELARSLKIHCDGADHRRSPREWGTEDLLRENVHHRVAPFFPIANGVSKKKRRNFP
jgi:hypothetical protein